MLLVKYHIKHISVEVDVVEKVESEKDGIKTKSRTS